MSELKRIDLTSGEFTANGVHYTVAQYLSIERYCDFQILEKELGYGFTFEGMYKKFDLIEKEMNKLNFVNVAVLLSDVKRGILKVHEREPIALKLCALFINADGEDMTVINNDMIDVKIKNWKAEGLAMNDFFTLALNMVSGFIGIYNSLSQSTSAILNDQKLPKIENQNS